MNHYTIRRVTGTPDWDQIPALQVSNHLWLPELPIRMEAKFCYDQTGIHVHMQAWEENIRAEYKAPLSPVFEDSCMEFFFSPVEGDSRYFNIETNPNGFTYIGFGPNMPELVRLVIQNENEVMNRKVGYTADGWELSYTVPVSVIRVFFPGYKLESGMVIRANVYKCGDLCVQPHFMAWNPIDLPNPQFHCPQFFGTMTLE